MKSALTTDPNPKLFVNQSYLCVSSTGGFEAMTMDRGLAEATYTLLDRVLMGGPVPPGARGTISRVIDQSKSVAQVELAQQISVEIHRLEGATLSKDDEMCRQVRASLKDLAARCIQARIDATSALTPEASTRGHPLSGLGYYSA